MTTEVIDTAEIVHQPVGQVSIYQSTDAAEQLAEARARAKVLVEVVDEQGLAKRFGGPNSKPHLYVEAWQFLASQFGLIPDIEWTKELDNGWEARAMLKRLSDQAVVSHAEGECRREEGNWKDAKSYAIRSMAQTRAVSKVCRVALSAVVVMAGYSATPAEEMDGVTKELTLDDPHCPACLKINSELVGVWENDKKPFWKCKAKDQCAAWDGRYPWSGWHESWENSVADYTGGIIEGEATEITIDPDERTNRVDYIARQTMEIAGMPYETDARGLMRQGLISAISEGSVDVEAAIGWPIESQPSDDELRAIILNLNLAEAEAVAVAAAQLAEPFDDKE